MQKFQKKIVGPAVYQVKPGQLVEITPERIKHWADTATQMLADGLLIPAPYHHDVEAVPVRREAAATDIDASKNAGFWSRIWVDSDGWLAGELEAATEADAESIGTKVKGVSLLAPPVWAEGGKEWTDPITHIALTNHPVAAAPDQFLALSADMALSAEAGEGLNQGDDTTSNASCETAIELLSAMGIALPEDTCDSNFLDRLVVALTAVNSFKAKEGGDVTKAPQGAKVAKPSPVAMSHELAFAVGLLAKHSINNPETGAPFTEAELEAAAAAAHPAITLSAEQQAIVNFATSRVQGDYRSRIEAAIETGRVTPAYATEHLLPLLPTTIQFSADGSPLECELDRVLKCVEALPANSVLSGQTPTSYAKIRRAGVAFSVDAPPQPKIEPRPLSGADQAAPMDDAEVERILAEVG